MYGKKINFYLKKKKVSYLFDFTLMLNFPLQQSTG